MLASALEGAVRACSDEVVDLLLKRGPDLKCAGYRGNVLTVAAKAGTMVMLRKLLDAGVRFRSRDIHTLHRALQLEHTAKVELLLDAGVGSPCLRLEALKMAEDMGLESMADLLRAKGVGGPGSD